MTSTIETIVRLLFEAKRDLFLVFDRDGTLVPFTENPADAVMDRRVRTLLNRLAQIPRVTVGVLSARSIAKLQEDLPDGLQILAGNYGLEIESPGHECFCQPQAHDARKYFDKAKDLLDQKLPADFQAILEDHGLSLCLHWHQVPESKREKFHSIIADIAKEIPELYFKTLTSSYEIWPDIEWDKSYGIAKMMELSKLDSKQAIPLFAGDSLVDEPAFSWSNSNNGTSILIGKHRPSTAAKFTLATPAALHNLIERIEQEAENTFVNT